MRKAAPQLIVALLLAAMAVACASVAPGQDPVLVNAERSLQAATGTLDTLFKLDYDNWKTIDPLLPNWKAAINNLRAIAPPILFAANGTIRAYRDGLTLLRTIQQQSPADPAAVEAQQAKLNQLASQLGQRLVEMSQLVKQANDAIAQWGSVKGGTP